jgi:phospholipase/carboxylesterase
VRGRATEEGTNRWFRRIDATSFDQADIRSEAEAFSAFVEGAIASYGLDANRLAFVGYSNGANFLAAAIQLYPCVARRAALLRGTQALEDPPATDLSGTSLLMLNGRDDPFAQNRSALADDLRARGAKVELRELPADHELSADDVAEAATWIERNLQAPAPV